jgi:hypothetical protein
MQKASDKNSGSQRSPLKTLNAAFKQAKAHLDAGEATKIVIGAGNYRETLGHQVLTGRAKDTLLVLEGAGADKTTWSGSEVWSAPKWKSLGNGIYVADWPYEWGNHSYPWETPRVLGHRSEMVFVNGQLLRQVLLEDYDFSRTGDMIDHGNRQATWTYRGFQDPAKTLTIGSFGVD